MKYLYYFKENLSTIRYKKTHYEPGEEVSRFGVWQIEAYDGRKKIGYIRYDVCNMLYGGAWDGITTHVKDGEIEKILDNKYNGDEVNFCYNDSDDASEIYFCDLQLVYVNEEYRKQKIGETMMKMASQHCEKMKITDIFGFSMPYFDKEAQPEKREINDISDVDIEKLVKWYEKLGFKRIKKYHDGWLIWMSL